jgi:hypothetical protein
MSVVAADDCCASAGALSGPPVWEGAGRMVCFASADAEMNACSVMAMASFVCLVVIGISGAVG